MEKSLLTYDNQIFEIYYEKLTLRTLPKSKILSLECPSQNDPIRTGLIDWITIG